MSISKFVMVFSFFILISFLLSITSNIYVTSHYQVFLVSKHYPRTFFDSISHSTSHLHIYKLHPTPQGQNLFIIAFWENFPSIFYITSAFIGYLLCIDSFVWVIINYFIHELCRGLCCILVLLSSMGILLRNF